MRLPRLTPRSWRSVFLVCLIVHLLALYWPVQPDETQLFPGADKVVHLSIFAGVTAAALLAGWPARWVIPLVAVHAPVSEYLQGTLIHRDPSMFDALADLAGVAVGAVGARLLRGRVVESPSVTLAEHPAGATD